VGQRLTSRARLRHVRFTALSGRMRQRGSQCLRWA